MQPNKKTRSLKGIKILLTAGVLTGTVTLWNLFADQALKKAQAEAASTKDPNQTNLTGLVSPTALPLPTQIPLRVVNSKQNTSLTTSSQPVVQTVIINQSSGTSSSGGTISNPIPVTSTGSSK